MTRRADVNNWQTDAGVRDRFEEDREQLLEEERDRNDWAAGGWD